MIDPGEYIPVSRAGDHMPGKPHRQTVIRYAMVGARAGKKTVKLRTIMSGGRRFTHPTWIDEFVAACSGDATLSTVTPDAGA